MDPRVPAHPTLTQRIRTSHRSSAWRRPSRRYWSTRWWRPGSERCTASSGTRPTPSSTPCAAMKSDIQFIHVRNEEAGAFAAGADAQISGRPTAVLGLFRTGQSPPRQRAVRLPAQRGARLRHRHPHPQHGDRERLLPGDQPRGHLLGLHQLLRPPVHPRTDAAHLRARHPGSDPRAWRGHGDRPGGRRGPDGRARDAAPSAPHGPAGQQTHRRRPRQGGRAGLPRGQDRHPRRGGDAARTRRGAEALRDAPGAGVVSPTAARTCSRPTTRRASG